MSSEWDKEYDAFLAKAKEITVLQTTAAIVQWDMETKMPPKGIQLRSEQLALLKKIGHNMLVDPQIGELLIKLEKKPNYDNANQVQKRNIHLARKTYDEQTKLPEKLVVEMARQQVISVSTWKKAKEAKDWSMFRPELTKTVELSRQAAEILKEVKGTKSQYDALLDMFEPKITTTIISKVFDEMKKGLIKIMGKIESQPKPEIGFLSRPVSIEVQRGIADSIVEFIGYDVKSKEAGGRIDETEHPFTTGYYTDVRITTKYHEDQVASSIYAILHEGGHAIFEQGLPLEYMYQPVGVVGSYGIHEAMSRFVENMVGRSPEFWKYYYPVFMKLTGDTFKDITSSQMEKAMNYVTPSKVRIEADEVTYGLHIIIRFEMERDLFAEKITIDELPQVWNQKYKEYLGLDIENDSEGVMQDTHWASGYFGYFPSYALGNIYDGVLLTKLNKDTPDWLNSVSQGNFTPVKEWLQENIYQYANLYDPEDLVKHVTGTGLEVKPYLDYLNNKFKAMYNY